MRRKVKINACTNMLVRQETWYIKISVHAVLLALVIFPVFCQDFKLLMIYSSEH